MKSRTPPLQRSAETPGRRHVTPDSPDLHRVQGVARRPVHRHLPHDEHHDFSSLVIWQISTKEPCRGQQRGGSEPEEPPENRRGARRRTDGLDDGVLHDALVALPAAHRRHAAAGVPPGAVAQLQVHAHPQVFEQRVEDLQDRRTCRHTNRLKTQRVVNETDKKQPRTTKSKNQPRSINDQSMINQ